MYRWHHDKPLMLKRLFRYQDRDLDSPYLLRLWTKRLPDGRVVHIYKGKYIWNIPRWLKSVDRYNHLGQWRKHRPDGCEDRRCVYCKWRKITKEPTIQEKRQRDKEKEWLT